MHSRFFNKKLVELDNKIESVREMNNNGFSLRNISKKLKIPLTTLTRIFKKNISLLIYKIAILN